MNGKIQFARIEKILAGTCLTVRRDWRFGLIQTISLYCESNAAQSEIRVFSGSGFDAEREAAKLSLVFHRGVGEGLSRTLTAAEEKLLPVAPGPQSDGG